MFNTKSLFYFHTILVTLIFVAAPSRAEFTVGVEKEGAEKYLRYRTMNTEISAMGGNPQNFSRDFVASLSGLQPCLDWTIESTFLSPYNEVVTVEKPETALRKDGLDYNTGTTTYFTVYSSCPNDVTVSVFTGEIITALSPEVYGGSSLFTVPAGLSCTVSGSRLFDLGEFSVDQIMQGAESKNTLLLTKACSPNTVVPTITFRGIEASGNDFKLGDDIRLVLSRYGDMYVVNGEPVELVNNSTHFYATLYPLTGERPKGGVKSATLTVTIDLP